MTAAAGIYEMALSAESEANFQGRKMAGDLEGSKD